MLVKIKNFWVTKFTMRQECKGYFYCSICAAFQNIWAKIIFSPLVEQLNISILNFIFVTLEFLCLEKKIESS